MWSENNYVETRFSGGMNNSVEPHTLDRDDGVMADVLNMLCRTQGLRTRKGWRLVNDLAGTYSPLPTIAPVGIFTYETDIEEEETQEEENDDDDTGGTTGGGGVITGDDDDKADPAPGGPGGPDVPDDPGMNTQPGSYTIAASPTPVMPHVPFTLTITWAGQGTAAAPAYIAAKMLAGLKDCLFWAKPLAGSGPWTRGMVVYTTDRSYTQVRFAAGPDATTWAAVDVAYTLPSFLPNLPTAIMSGELFTYTITCSHGGSAVTGYIGKGSGMSTAWRFTDETGNAKTGNMEIKSGAWSNGVYTGTARAVPGPEATQLILATTYKSETLLDIALFTLDEVLLFAPAKLHVYGGSGELRVQINGEDTTLPSVALYLNGTSSPSCMVDSGGQQLDFSQISENWTGNTWIGDVFANASVGAGTATVKASRQGVELASRDVAIHSALTGSVTCGGLTAPGVAIDLSIAIRGDGNMALSRLPDSVISVVVTDGDGSAVTPTLGTGQSFSGWSTGAWSGTIAFADLGNYTLSVYDNRDHSLICSCDIDVVAEDGTLLVQAPNSLHCYGEADTLKICVLSNGAYLPAASTESATVTFQVDNVTVDINDYLEDSEGNRLDLSAGWSGGVWQKSVMAKTGASACLIKVTATYLNGDTTVTELDFIEITRDLAAVVAFTNNRVAVNAEFGLTITMTSPRAGTLSRFPSTGAVTVSAAPQDATSSAVMSRVDGEVAFTFTGGVCSLTRCKVNAECVYVISVSDSNGVLDIASITVSNAAIDTAALVEAINERYIGKNSSTRAYATDSLSTLRTKAGEGIHNYVNGTVSDAGVYAIYSATTGPAAIPEVPADSSGNQAWIESTYAVVCATCTRILTSVTKERLWYEGANRHPSATEAADNQYGYISTESLEECANKAYKAALAAYKLDDARDYYFYALSSKESQTQVNLNIGWGYIYLGATRIKCNLGNHSHSVSMRYYFTGRDIDNWNSFGHNVTARNSTSVIFRSGCAADDAPGWTPYQGLSRPSGFGRYWMDFAFCSCKYGFKHK